MQKVLAHTSCEHCLMEEMLLHKEHEQHLQMYEQFSL